MNLTTTLDRVLSTLGYPTVTHGLINRYAEGLELEIAQSARVSSGCLFRGEIGLGPMTRVSRGCILNGDITVDKQTNFEPNCDVIGNVEFGKYCAIAKRSTFQQINHEMTKPSMQIRLYDEVLDSELPPASNGPITIGNDVWIGIGSTVLSGVTVGNGAVIGAGSVVTNDVKPYSIVGGVPAEHIKWRFPEEVREKLLEIEWWTWDEATIRDNREFFERELQDGSDIPVFAPDSETEDGTAETGRLSIR
ncbi:CatB-related O-acetyltransferase [Halostagnicola sp. A-GB9-2]|uniref:CatB-related O-acetyltransferase n=1 Tax=Halostagnicola sp. A-GB9-2 TaxID=3048066 RepID=UPI0024BF6FC9|nr:CatB-related O-acetyltransferase [Halostagnicola sp. A-GB9-2]MDJ1433536.1 CatB-related O-acetyltransferase [Halostagnicola sp. A-GB9-2]